MTRLVFDWIFFDDVQEVMDVITYFVVAGVFEFVDVLARGVFPWFLATLNTFMTNPITFS